MNNGKIDINTIVGFLLIGGILFYFGWFSQPDTPPQDKDPQSPDSTEVVKETQRLQEKEPVVEATEDSLSRRYFGAFGAAADPSVDAEIFTIENEVLELGISSKGGAIVEARLKNFRTHDSLPLYLIRNNAAFHINLEADRVYNTAELNFTGIQSGDDELIMRLKAENGAVLEYHYRLNPDNYMLDWDIVSENFNQYFSDESSLIWEQKTFRHEKNAEYERTMTALGYRLADEDEVEELSASGNEQEEIGGTGWVAYKQQFFSSILWNKSGQFDQSQLVSNSLAEEDEDHTKFFASKLSLNRSAGDIHTSLGLYLGPNKYNILDAYDQHFEELIPLGWGILGWINRGIVLTFFNWLEAYGLNYGLIIFIIALVIKLILFPLTYTSYRSMAKMRVLKPEIDEINEKHKDKDPMKKQQAVMQLYQQAGVNPLGGCIPMLLQLPILIALFRFFPASIELRQQPFLWADDLSTYDSIASIPYIPFYGDHISLFTLLMTISTLIYTWMNQQLTGQNQQFPQMKYVIYLMPVIFLGVFNNYAAGLSYYYFVANMITFGQQFAIRSFIDEDKIRARIQEKKKKPKKENRFMRRMRELQEQQESQNRQMRRKK